MVEGNYSIIYIISLFVNQILRQFGKYFPRDPITETENGFMEPKYTMPCWQNGYSEPGSVRVCIKFSLPISRNHHPTANCRLSPSPHWLHGFWEPVHKPRRPDTRGTVPIFGARPPWNRSLEGLWKMMISGVFQVEAGEIMTYILGLPPTQ